MSIDIIQKISTDNINKSAHVWSNPVVGTESYVYGTGPQISGIEEQYTNRFDDDSSYFNYDGTELTLNKDIFNLEISKK